MERICRPLKKSDNDGRSLATWIPAPTHQILTGSDLCISCRMLISDTSPKTDPKTQFYDSSCSFINRSIISNSSYQSEPYFRISASLRNLKSCTSNSFPQAQAGSHIFHLS